MTETDLPEPSMEEILASIRRIISEDEASITGVLQTETAADPEDDVLVLTERAPAEPSPSYAEPAEEEQGLPEAPESALVAPETAVSAVAAFQKLSYIVDNAAPPSRLTMPAASPTLEDITRDLMRPMLKSWLDEHLPAIVRARVDEEVERITRGRVR